MTWVNQPRQWHRDGRDLAVRTEAYSDFWRTTALGYERDSGHAFLAREQGDLVLEVTVSADFAAEHDEAGLMVRLNERIWVKAGLRLMGQELLAAVVATRDTSDLSLTPMPGVTGRDAVRFRLEREGNALRIFCGWAGEPARLLRLAHFPAGSPVGVGPMCCSPHRGGLEVRFTECELDTGRPGGWAWLG